MGRRTDLIVYLLIFILALGLGTSLYKQNLGKIDSLKAQIEEEKKKNEILGLIAILDKKVAAYQVRSFSSSEITQLLDQISQAAGGVGVTIDNFDPLPAIYREHYVELSVRLPLRCTYHKLGEFLSRLENNQEFIWVKELRMQKPTVIDPKEKKIPYIDLVIGGIYLKK